MFKMEGKYSKIPRLSDKSLKILVERTEKTLLKMRTISDLTRKKLYHPTLREGKETWEFLWKRQKLTKLSITRLVLFRRRLRYWLGKRRGEKCLAFVHKGNWEVRCRIFRYGNFDTYKNFYSYKTLFSDFCSYCLLKKKEIKQRVQWLIILGVEK